MNNKHKYSTIVLISIIVLIGGGIAVSELIGYSSVQCTGTDKLSNVSFNGTTINGVCTEEAGGTIIYNNITNNITYNITNNITNNITVASNTITKYLSYEHNQTTNAYALLPNFTTTLETEKLYEIRCRLMTNSNITANSPRFRFNVSGTVVRIAQSCETSTSGTARYQLSTLENSLACASTASLGANLPTPFYYEAMIENNGASTNFTIEFYGETTATQYRVYQGSMCEIERLN